MPTATGAPAVVAALIHSKVDAPGYQSLTTHLFDEDGDHLDSDTAFAVKPSAVRTFISRTHLLHGSDGPWFSAEYGLVLTPSQPSQPTTIKEQQRRWAPSTHPNPQPPPRPRSRRSRTTAPNGC
ncbi:hypothetical protein [Streptomyces canus]|uniref:hypothetical protein n=1 Tax=Streptomyces canus TaxID=58343 RepID=UPI002B1D41D3|nr:hypothetical protein [Streptomyces canus]